MKNKFLPLTLGGLGIGITEFVMMGLLPDISRDLQVSIPKAGHLISAYAIGVVVGAPFLVAIAGKYPPKKILMALMAMFTFFNAFSAFAPDFNSLFISRLLAGLPHGAFFGVGSVVASKLALKGKEAQAVSLMFLGLTLANIFGVPLGTYIGHHYSWRLSFALVGIVGVITLASLHYLLPSIEAQPNRNLKKELSFFKGMEAWLIIAMISVGTGGLFCWISYISPMMTSIAGFQEASVTYILVLAGIGMLVGNLFGGFLADRFSPGKASAAMLFAMTITLIVVHFISFNQIAALIMTFITGAVAFALAAPIQMLMIRTAKGAEMLAASASQASFNIGNALGAFLGGLPLVYHFDYTWPALVGALMAFIGAILALIIINRKRTNPADEQAVAAAADETEHAKNENERYLEPQACK